MLKAPFPYFGGKSRVAHIVWERFGNVPNYPDMRIALCGYEGEHEMPDSWTCVAWKNRGGYGLQGDGQGRANAKRERIWFSPHCLSASLFDQVEATA